MQEKLKTPKIPPLLLALSIAVLMYLFAPLALPLSNFFYAGLFVLLIGLTIMLCAAWQFRRAKTTLNPIALANASQLVDNGIFAYSRNPMYLGMAIILFGLAIALTSWPSLVGPLFFVIYINEFQIRPEEQILASIFGEPYQHYLKRVRRWL